MILSFQLPKCNYTIANWCPSVHPQRFLSTLKGQKPEIWYEGCLYDRHQAWKRILRNSPFQTPLYPKNLQKSRKSRIFGHIFSVRSERSVPLRVTRLKLGTKGTNISIFRRVKRIFEILTFTPFFTDKTTEIFFSGGHILAVLSEFQKTVRARKLNFGTKDAYGTIFRREKRFFEIPVFRPFLTQKTCTAENFFRSKIFFRPRCLCVGKGQKV